MTEIVNCFCFSEECVKISFVAVSLKEVLFLIPHILSHTSHAIYSSHSFHISFLDHLLYYVGIAFQIDTLVVLMVIWRSSHERFERRREYNRTATLGVQRKSCMFSSRGMCQ